MKQIETFSFGVGDRFGHQGEAQLAAFEKAAAAGRDHQVRQRACTLDAD